MFGAWGLWFGAEAVGYQCSIEPGAFCVEVEGKLIVLEQPGDRSCSRV